MQFRLGLLLLMSAGAASAGVTVKYDAPEKFKDVPTSALYREQTLSDLSAHFAKLAQRLPAGQDLVITVKDIDLAGREYPTSRRVDGVRALYGSSDWPTMHLEYVLERDGQVIKSGDEHVSNMGYQTRLSRYTEGDNLRYEKQMLDDWFSKTFEPKVGSK